MAGMDENSVDTIVTDPPGGIRFMGKLWDNLAAHKPHTERARQVWLALEGLTALGMLQKWEAGFLYFTVDWATAAARVAKPGSMALVWAIPRTSDLTKFGLRLAGWEIRDTIYHLFGSGFPKSADISKHIDKAAGAEREVVGKRPIYYPDSNNWSIPSQNPTKDNIGYGGYRRIEKNGCVPITSPATDAAALWNGWGTALKPAAEEWVVAMAPRDGTFANNALTWGVAGLNIDGARVPLNGDSVPTGSGRGFRTGKFCGSMGVGELTQGPTEGSTKGRWPANLILSHHPECVQVGQHTIIGDPRGDCSGKRPAGFVDTGADTGDGEPNARVYGDETVGVWNCHPDCPIRLLDAQSGERVSGKAPETGFIRHSDKQRSVYSHFEGNRDEPTVLYGDRGGASRYFQQCGYTEGELRFRYQAKASRAERWFYCTICSGAYKMEEQGEHEHGKEKQDHIVAHPTQKPLSLMRYLVRLTRTPTGGVVLDPFMGSGTTGMACAYEGRDFIGIDITPEYVDIARARIEAAQAEMVQAEMVL
jgi:site-specific DNA-methyltransferase (adenine-specific)